MMGGVAPLFFIISCRQNVKPDPRILSARIELYNRFLIWQKYDDAEKMVDENFLPVIEKFSSNRRFVNIKVIKVNLLPNGKKAEVILRREYYFTDNNVVKKELVRQTWEFKNGNWFLTGEKRF